ncbi:MAG: bifunctional DNA-formamidopyrimidine glycosylase/DNA-(apurinic or apyrimidinic site) lyase [candidate division WOR-3 bacterium]|uniref:Formamidopyrimidine-DNA glycosylase n=1 Tax=candidate division WOR-3 bacterium TaxID=2052148 RepID=A0A7C3IWD6_UNCW3|nr:bifunctional DNA-formamidopyrimidine glycosylase/DNA-(apurinic or apyrimidinic site) lyase [candidate division WOR-3 bacterium]
MPELPEVETVRRRLTPEVEGREIVGVVIRRPDIVGYPTVPKFRVGVLGRRITGVSRRGKYLVFYLSDERLLVVHLRLSGHLRVLNNGTPQRFERIRFRFSDGRSLVFIEPRVLGRVYLVAPEEVSGVLKGLSRLGKEPISREFSADYLQRQLAGRRTRIKSVIMDQRVCAGVGNIYSDEALFRAGISPMRPASSLSRQEVVKLTQALRKVIKAGIRYLGTTMSDERYLLPDGSRGRFGELLQIFGREGEVCSVCGTEIRRIKIGNRSSYYCPECQR